MIEEEPSSKVLEQLLEEVESLLEPIAQKMDDDLQSDTKSQDEYRDLENDYCQIVDFDGDIAIEPKDAKEKLTTLRQKLQKFSKKIGIPEEEFLTNEMVGIPYAKAGVQVMINDLLAKRPKMLAFTINTADEAGFQMNDKQGEIKRLAEQCIKEAIKALIAEEKISVADLKVLAENVELQDIIINEAINTLDKADDGYKDKLWVVVKEFLS